MKQRFLSLAEDEHIYQRAVIYCFKGKWARNDVLSFIEKNAGIPRHELLIDELERHEDRTCEHEHNRAKTEAVDSCALALEETVEQILSGADPEIDAPRIRSRPDGMTGKTREIALLCIMHQLVEHVVFEMLEPMFKAKLYQTQHASIPGHGQTRLKDQIHKYLRKRGLNIRYGVKTDMRHAYASVTYDVVIKLLKQDIPDAGHIIRLTEYLADLAPGRHLIIGGYLDAWFFNYVMSKLIGHAYSLGQTRRKKFTRYAIRLVTFMDDMWVAAASIKAIRRVVAGITHFARDKLGMEVKVVSGITMYLPVEEERIRRHRKGAAKGTPVVDMGGYKMTRSHITIRRRVFLRIRRQMLRGWKEFGQNGTVSVQRARKIISYNGYIKQSNSQYMQSKYHTNEMMQLAKRVASYHVRLAERKRMERLDDLRKRTVKYQTEISDDRKTSGWPAEDYNFQKYLGNLRRRRQTVPV